MKLKLLTFTFLILSITSFSQKPRTGTIIKFNEAINLVSFNSNEVIKGKELTQKKKPIVIFFWLSTCKPCIKELNAFNKIEDFNELQEKAFIMVVSDDKPSRYSDAKQIAIKNNWKFNLYFDKNYKLRNNLLNRWYGVPQVMIINTDKKIILHKLGYRKNREKVIAQKIREL